MRTLLALTLLLAACEKQDTSALEQTDRKLEDKVQEVAASAAQGADRVQELEKKVDLLSKQVAALEAKLTVAAVPPRPPSRTRQQPDPKDVYAVPIDGDATDGPPDALVTIVEGYEYACPYCEKVRSTLTELRRIYGDDLRVVKKSFVVHPQVATDAAKAACAAHRQGKFAEMDALLWDKAFSVRKFDVANLDALAAEARLDVSRYQRDFAGDCVAKIAQDQAELQQVGQGATPTFYVNGRFLSGAQPVATFQAVIDEELKLAQGRVASGTPRSRYYREWVLDRGLPRYLPAAPTGP